jgi:hypothetical protein
MQPAQNRFARVLSRHAYLKTLSLYSCRLFDEDIRLLADILVNNTTLQGLRIWDNHITSIGLADITRLLLVSTTRLQTISFNNRHIFDNDTVTRQFVTALERNGTLQNMPELYKYGFRSAQHREQLGTQSAVESCALTDGAHNHRHHNNGEILEPLCLNARSKPSQSLPPFPIVLVPVLLSNFSRPVHNFWKS